MGPPMISKGWAWCSTELKCASPFNVKSDNSEKDEFCEGILGSSQARDAARASDQQTQYSEAANSRQRWIPASRCPIFAPQGNRTPITVPADIEELHEVAEWPSNSSSGSGRACSVIDIANLSSQATNKDRVTVQFGNEHFVVPQFVNHARISSNAC